MKRWLCIVLSLILMSASVLRTTPLSAKGDITFSTADVRAILIALTTGAELNERLNVFADYDKNGVVDTADARNLLIAVLMGNNTVKEPIDDTFRLSGISDVTDTTGKRTYSVYAPYTDTYTLTSSNVASVTLSKDGTIVASGKPSLSVALTENETYELTVTTAAPNTKFDLSVTANDHVVTLPYDVAEPLDTSGFSLSSNASYALTPAKIDYVKREGGTYIYSNNPEQFSSQHVGQAFMRNEGLSGEVYVTFEHANYAGRNVYLGYQLKKRLRPRRIRHRPQRRISMDGNVVRSTRVV